MKRIYRFVEPSAYVECTTASGERVRLPVISGILKHLTPDQLGELLADEAVARKYTREALRRAPWSAVRCFPRAWLVECLQSTDLPEGRRRALELVLGLDDRALARSRRG